ncbi:MAG: 3-isopropylmalate dehydratase small subunit [Alphaproteobacteria bacterium]
MQPFTRLTGVAAPLAMANVDTDMIIPKQFLTTIQRTGLGKGLFYELRTDADGKPTGRFVLDKPPYDKAQILVAGENFGCGSSREHAPWALLDFGIRCVIAPSFADIFYNNCFKNGVLPIKLPADQVALLMEDARDTGNPELTVDLVAQTIRRPNGPLIPFEMDPFRKRCLLEGLDDIGLTLEKGAAIAAFESRDRGQHPWLHAAAS